MAVSKKTKSVLSILILAVLAFFGYRAWQASQLIDSAGNKWSLGADQRVSMNGTRVDAGTVTKLWIQGGKAYILGTGGLTWMWDGTKFVQTAAAA